MLIFPAFPILVGEPDTLLAVESVVRHQHIAVDASTLGMQRIGFALGEGAGELHGPQHGADLLANVLWRVLLFDTGKSGKRVETQNEQPA